MKEKKINYLKNIIDIVFFLINICITYYALCKFGLNEWGKISSDKFYLNFFPNIVNIFLIYYISTIISVIWHELGHLIIGLISKLKFIYFNFFCFTVTSTNNKLVLKFKNNTNDYVGSCGMYFDQNINYNKYNIVFYFMSGVIFNLILALIFIILLFLSNNLYMNIISLFFIVQNVYLAIYNSIPFNLKSGSSTDMLKTIYCLKDPNYLRTLSNLSIILNLLDNNVKYQDMDEKLFTKPKTFIYPSDIVMAHFYIAYLTSKEKYSMVVNYSKKVLIEAKDLLTKYDINLLKVQLINCAFDNVKNYGTIKEYWDEEFDKFMDLMSERHPTYLYVNYVYLLKVEKNNEKANNLLDRFYMLENKYINKTEFEEIKNKINELNNDNK